MDNLQAYAIANLPPGLLEHVTAHGSSYWSLYQQLLSINASFQKHLIQPLYYGLCAPLMARLSSSPDIASVALLAVLLLVSLQVLKLAIRSVLFWIRLAFRLAFWGTFIGAVFWLYQRGFDGAADDIVHLQQVWKQEYRYWQQQEAAARRANRLW